MKRQPIVVRLEDRLYRKFTRILDKWGHSQQRVLHNMVASYVAEYEGLKSKDILVPRVRLEHGSNQTKN